MDIDKDRPYGIRYLVDEWNRPIPKDFKGTQVVDGITLSNNAFGYSDALVVVSLLSDGGVVIERADDVVSIGIFDSISQSGSPPRWLLELVREHIDHYLNHHCD